MTAIPEKKTVVYERADITLPEALSLLRRARGVIQGIVEVDPEEPLPALNAGICRRLLADLSEKL
jgi:hypothetical protein